MRILLSGAWRWRTSPKWPAALLLATLTSGVAAPGFAQEEKPAENPEEKADVLECAKAFEQAQVLRNEAKYVSATQEAQKCSQTKCGQALFTECSKLYTEFQQAVPSVVLSASDKKGNEVPEARVVIDATVNVDQLDGRPLDLEPGNHQFQFSAPGMVDITRRVTLLAGEKFRSISVKFSAAKVADQPEAPRETPHAAQPVRRVGPTLAPRRIPTVSYVLGGVSLLAAGGFVALRVSGSNRFDQLKQSCSPDCADSSVNSVEQTYTLSYAALGLSAAALAGALGFYFLQPRTPLGTDSAFFVSPVPHGASARIMTRF